MMLIGITLFTWLFYKLFVAVTRLKTTPLIFLCFISNLCSFVLMLYAFLSPTLRGKCIRNRKFFSCVPWHFEGTFVVRNYEIKRTSRVHGSYRDLMPKWLQMQCLLIQWRRNIRRLVDKTLWRIPRQLSFRLYLQYVIQKYVYYMH